MGAGGTHSYPGKWPISWDCNHKILSKMVKPQKAEGRNHAFLDPSQGSSSSPKGGLGSMLLFISVCRLESKGLGPGDCKDEAFSFL